MIYVALSLLMAISFTFLSGRNADHVHTVIVTNVTNITLGCILSSNDEECKWKGPKLQEISSGNATKYRIKRKKEGDYCNLTISQLETVDEGIWNCHSESGRILASWRVILSAPPRQPVMYLLDGATRKRIPKHINVFDENHAPPVLNLECASRMAKPAQDSISWLINGHPPHRACHSTTEEPPGYFTARTSTIIVIHKDEGLGLYPVANVTCVVTHVTGQSAVTRAFGLNDYPRSVKLTQEDIAGRPGAKRLKCMPIGYPWFIQYSITKQSPPPTIQQRSQELIVTESGEYTCTGFSEGGSESITTPYYTVSIGDTSSGTHLSASLWLMITTTLITAGIVSRRVQEKL